MKTCMSLSLYVKEDFYVTLLVRQGRFVCHSPCASRKTCISLSLCVKEDLYVIILVRQGRFVCHSPCTVKIYCFSMNKHSKWSFIPRFKAKCSDLLHFILYTILMYVDIFCLEMIFTALSRLVAIQFWIYNIYFLWQYIGLPTWYTYLSNSTLSQFSYASHSWHRAHLALKTNKRIRN